MFANELVFLAHLAIGGVFLLMAARLGRIWLTAFIVVCTILMNITVTKNMPLLGLSVTGGNVEYALVFLANDVLNEHYGRRTARQAILVGFGCGVLVIALMYFALLYAPGADDAAQPHLMFFFDVRSYPRIVIASMASYLTSQWLDTALYAAIRRHTGSHRYLWLRSNGSTWVSQAFDTVFFTTAALLGTVVNSWQQWWGAVVLAFAVKVVAAVLATPFLYLTTSRPLRPRDLAAEIAF